MTLADMKNYVYKRTGTSANSFSATNMLIALNNGYERVNTLMRKWIDNYRPTLWSSGDLSTGTATPVVDSLFHELIPLWASYQHAADKVLPNANALRQEIADKEKELEEFYGNRNYKVTTVTLASPGVFTLKNHNLITGDRVSFITTGALPTGLSVDTFYYVIAGGLDDDNFQVSATRDGSAVNTSVSQSGTHYLFSDSKLRGFTPTRDSNK